MRIMKRLSALRRIRATPASRWQRRPLSHFENPGSKQQHRLRHVGLFGLGACAATATVVLGGISTNLNLTTTTHCDNGGGRLQRHGTQTAVVDLVVPSLQALLRVFRLLQTTGMIVLDYELYKWQQKATKFVNKYSERVAAKFPAKKSQEQDFDNLKDEVDLSQMTTPQLRQHWEREVKRRNETFEEAQMDYALPSSKHQIPEGMTREEWKQSQKQAMKDAAAAWVQAQDILEKLGGSQISQIHKHAAQRLVKLCRTNAGVYIKIGQHLANMDYLIPQEYIDGLSCLLDDAPTSTYEQVQQVVQEELGGTPEQLFNDFDPVPIASASLAQVHVAYDKSTGQKLAIKVQHQGLRETCKGDLLALTTVVHTLEFFLEDFNFGWIADEIAPQLPLELDFANEGRNAERAASFLQQRQKRQQDHPDVVIPKVHWQQTSKRVLCMAFEEGFRATNVEAIRQANMKPKDVAQLISRVFHSQTFLDAWVHCDPHPANVLLRKSPVTGKPQMVLVDHGLYKQLDDDFRITYAELWKALMMADIPTIQSSCQKLGVDGMLYTLLSGLLTARPFDEVVERSKTGSFDLSGKVQHKSQQDKAVIRGYAQKFLVDILTMIDKLPRQMVLLLKMNDCLRHIDYALGSPTNNLVVAGRVAAQAVYEHKLKAPSISTWDRFKAWADYVTVMWRIQLYDIGIWWMEWNTRQNLTK
ncbi:aarF domain-containing protein kinase 1 [Seminavis robusta]|uniref:AarF domain-containing protein kinase 1 n=1 Tax=Seminavis robusta TaxID=568900 RepID=A0A9N8E9K4_9STRA|nr:aarF domain-containing protein kinase 1 [Seminavis robusta]|eukprot:Sro646_g180670.1 aarF domain-containing protein kinase 1 (699) ;mRNA; f:2413-4509